MGIDTYIERVLRQEGPLFVTDIVHAVGDLLLHNDPPKDVIVDDIKRACWDMVDQKKLDWLFSGKMGLVGRGA